MRRLSRRVRFIGLGSLVLLLAVAGILAKQRAGQPQVALAAADSTKTGEEAAAKPARKGKKGKEVEEKPVPVETDLASPRDLPSYFGATGSLEATRQVVLISKAQGQIVTVLVEEGDVVRKGQTLIEIEHRKDELLLDKAKVTAETAAREMERISGLMDRGLGSESDFEVRKEAAQVAVIERDLAQANLNDKIVLAPFDGQITARHIELGQTVNPGRELLTLADVSPLEMRLHLPERVVENLSVGQTVELRSDLDPAASFEGRVDRIAPSVDPSTSTVKVTLGVDRPSSRVRVGSFVRARIMTDMHRMVLSIPKKALVAEAGAQYVFVAAVDSVLKVSVETGYADEEHVEILSGLALGDRIVTVGQGGLRHGSKIRDLDQTGGTQTAPSRERP